MSFDDLYPIIKEQAYYAVLRYEEPERRKDSLSLRQIVINDFLFSIFISLESILLNFEV